DDLPALDLDVENAGFAAARLDRDRMVGRIGAIQYRRDEFRDEKPERHRLIEIEPDRLLGPFDLDRRRAHTEALTELAGDVAQKIDCRNMADLACGIARLVG